MTEFHARSVIIDCGASPGRLNASLAELGGPSWTYFGKDIQRFSNLKGALSDKASLILPGQLINAIAREIRREFINFDTHIDVDNASLQWQSTDTAEKNPYCSDLFYNCCAYLAFNRILQNLAEDLVVFVDDWFLGQRMAHCARELGHLSRVLTKHEVLDHLPPTVGQVRHRLGQLRHIIQSRIVFIREIRNWKKLIDRWRGSSSHTREYSADKIDALIVTWSGPNTFPTENSKRTDTFWGELPGLLTDRGLTVGYLINPLAMVYSPEQIIENARVSRDDVLLVQECLDWRDVILIIWKSLFRPWKSTERFVIQGIDLSDLLIEEGRKERAKSRQCWAMQYYYVGRYLRKRGIRPAVLLYPYENQPWEKALRLGIKHYLPETPAVAYQHAPFAPLWLGAFPSDKDSAAHGVPDKLVLHGSAWQSIMADHGLDDGTLTTGPAFRFTYLFDQNDAGTCRRTKRESDGKAVLTAFSIGYWDSFELAHKTIAAFRSDTDINVLLKFHPMTGDQDVISRLLASAIASLGLQALPQHFQVTQDSISKLLSEVDLVLHNGTSVAVEAWSRRVPTLLVQSDLWFDMDTLAWLGDVSSGARTPEEIRWKSLTILHQHRPISEDQEANHAKMLRQVFQPLQERSMQSVFDLFQTPWTGCKGYAWHPSVANGAR